MIITKGSLDNHEKEIMKVLSRLDKENLRICPNGNHMARLKNKPERDNPNRKENKIRLRNGPTPHVKTT